MNCVSLLEIDAHADDKPIDTGGAKENPDYKPPPKHRSIFHNINITMGNHWNMSTGCVYTYFSVFGNTGVDFKNRYTIGVWGQYQRNSDGSSSRKGGFLLSYHF